MNRFDSNGLQTRLSKAAASLCERIDGARVVVFVSEDGFEIATAGRESVRADRLAAIVGSLGALGATAAQESGLGPVGCQIVDCDNGRLVVRRLNVNGTALMVAVVVGTSTLLGLVLMHLKAIEGVDDQ